MDMYQKSSAFFDTYNSLDFTIFNSYKQSTDEVNNEEPIAFIYKTNQQQIKSNK